MRVLLLVLALGALAGPVEEPTTREGNRLYERGELDEALASYTRAQVDFPDAPELHYNIGNVQFRKGDFDKALEEYRAVLDAGPELAKRAHFNIGNIHYQQERFREAADAYIESLRIDPDDVEARQNLELVLQKLEEQEQQRQQEQEQQSSPREEGDEEKDERQQEDKSTSKNEGQESDSGQDRDRDRSSEPSPDEPEAGESSAGGQPEELSREEAEQILQALAEMERAQQLRLQQRKKAAARGKGKIW